MDEQRKYLSQLIKKREPSVDKAATTKPLSSNTVTKDETIHSKDDDDSNNDISLFSDGIFAEVEIDNSKKATSTYDTALRYFTSLTPPEEKISRNQDPIRLKFYEMRSLSSNRPFAKSDAELFYKQAKFMADFTDNYSENETFHMYYPYYQHMSYEQLRTYFTWRSNFRNGKILPTSVSYMFVYAYELLHNIGVSGPEEGLDLLLKVWYNCMDFAPMLKSYIPNWFKDYHIYYNLSQNFSDFIKEHDLYEYFPIPYLFDESIENSLDLWNSISGYDITKSLFYNQGNETLMKDCFDAVIKSLKKLCANNNLNHDEFFVYTTSRRTIWQPFKQALFYDFKRNEDYSISIPGQGEYIRKNNRFAASVPIYYSHQKDLVAYIIKKTEACLRKQTGHKNKLTAVYRQYFYEGFNKLKELDKQGIGLSYTIDKAVEDFHKMQNLTVVNVDLSNLDRIRQEALGTQEKLIVPEDDNIALVVKGQELNLPAAVEINEMETNISDDSKLMDADMLETFPENGWTSFEKALTGLERETLSILIKGDTDIKTYAKENDIMLEVLADSINEKAFDHIGDSILETDDGMSIFDEYVESIIKLFPNAI
ncbi:MAG: TerB N-terminal domain-containing protein [Oscillospiraceae bacterium]|nr:TerB N-terminal domain-containing protein [Oscillospiraceae bacterium]